MNDSNRNSDLVIVYAIFQFKLEPILGRAAVLFYYRQGTSKTNAYFELISLYKYYPYMELASHFSHE